METTYTSIKKRRFINRGFLHGPVTPIYGFGAILIIYSSQWISNIVEDPFFSLLLGVPLSVILATALEFITGYILEKIFHLKWWDYSDRRLNLKGYICLEYTLLWGLLALLLIQVVHPMIAHFVDNIPVPLKRYLAALFVMYIIFDTLKSIIGTMDLRNTIINYFTLTEHEYKDKIIKYKRIFLAFPRLINLNAHILNRDVKSIINHKIKKIKGELTDRFHT